MITKDLFFYTPPTSRIPERIRLDLNENLLAAPPEIMMLMPDIQESDFKYYSPDVFNKCEKLFAARLRTSSQRLFFNHGSAEILKQIFLSLGRTDRPVVLCRPSWPFYESLCSIFGLGIKDVYLREGDSRFLFPKSEILRTKVDNPSVIVINSPHMPTGAMMNFDSICEIAAEMPNTYVVVDQAYWGFSASYRLDSERDLDARISEYPNIILVRTMSKFFGLAAVRVGYGWANEKVVTKLRMYGPLFGLSSPAAKYALTAMNQYKYYESLSWQVEEQRETLMDLINSKNYFKAYKAHGNFILIKSFHISTDELRARFDKEGVIVRSCESYGLNGFIRITVAGSATMELIVSAINGIEV
jgi:histidinol-phosphate aminotransferase